MEGLLYNRRTLDLSKPAWSVRSGEMTRPGRA